MKKIFVTYGDEGYEAAKVKISEEAKAAGVFDEVISYGKNDLSLELLSSEVIKIKRGGGLWSWKPDVILSTINKFHDGDILVYCDAGCSVSSSKEWFFYFNKLKTYDIIAQRLYQQTRKWTRKEIVDFFKENGSRWLFQYQYLATVIILKISPFTKKLIQEWQMLMIEHPELVMDVSPELLQEQLPKFIENRHDQAVFSAIIYKYINNADTSNMIYTQWEHIEDLDPFSCQAVRATRLRLGEKETVMSKIVKIVKRLIKDFVLKPFIYSPKQKGLRFFNGKI